MYLNKLPWRIGAKTGGASGRPPLSLDIDLLGALLLSVILEQLILVAFLLLEFDDEFAGLLWGLGLDDEVVVAVGAVLVSLFELGDIFSKSLLALLAGHYKLHSFHEFVVLTEHVFVALGAVEPFLAAGGAD